MNQGHIATKGLLVLPNLRIQNANSISSPFTHGFPSMTAFMGFMWALERKLHAINIHLGLEAVGVICHSYQEQTVGGYVDTFKLTRNPVDEKGEAAAIVEEGRIHLDITLVFSAFWKDSASDIFLQDRQAEREAVCRKITQCVSTMRIAGGSIVSTELTAHLLSISADPDQRAQDFRYWRRQWLPGFALVSREDLLQVRLRKLQTDNPEATLLDALLDLSRFNYRSKYLENGKVKWEADRRKGTGWIVPIPIGYAGLSPLYDPGTVRNVRDSAVPFRFVESLYSIGQWISPHRLSDVDEFLWEPDPQAGEGLYLLRNYSKSACLSD